MYTYKYIEKRVHVCVCVCGGGGSEKIGGRFFPEINLR